MWVVGLVVVISISVVCECVCGCVGYHVCRHGYVCCGRRVSGRRVLQYSCPCVCVCVQCVSGGW